MISRYLLIVPFLLITSFSAIAGNKIKYFFTQPVNTSVSKGVNAQYLNDCLGDTIVAYINRSKYTLDIAVYNYTSSFPAIAVAVNAAYLRGVRVRWIYDYSSSNTGIPLLNSAIKRLASPPDAGNYTIMHNKFMVIDANSADPAEAYVWTGSSNWNTQQFNDDYNNALVIQDKALAQAYRAHFNMMWGDTGIAPVSSLSKFGQYKTDLGAHTFTIDGKTVELYFSPSDGVNNKIQAAINTANTDMYCGMSTFTYSSDASALVTKANLGVYVAAIIDQSASSSSVSSTLSSGLGSSKFKLYTGPSLYHNKFLIVDPSNTCSDPLVLTGSHNWSVSADTKNDENTLIIHDATAANIYYQSFFANFASLGGTLTPITDCPAGVDNTIENHSGILVYPNPSNGEFEIQYTLTQTENVSIVVYNALGQKMTTKTINKLEQPGVHKHALSIPAAGIYVIRCVVGAEKVSKIITVEN